MIQLPRLILMTLPLLLMACSGGDQDQSSGHVWEEQTATIQKAEEVEAKIMEAAEQQRDAIEQQE